VEDNRRASCLQEKVLGTPSALVFDHEKAFFEVR